MIGLKQAESVAGLGIKSIHGVYKFGNKYVSPAINVLRSPLAIALTGGASAVGSGILQGGIDTLKLADRGAFGLEHGYGVVKNTIERIRK